VSLIKVFCYSNIQIARRQEPKDISQLAEEIGLYPSEVFHYGHKKAKIDLSVLKRLEHQKSGKYVVVAGYVLYYLCNVVLPLCSFVWV
jgi:formyltetrahydrofolate synthetase